MINTEYASNNRILADFSMKDTARNTAQHTSALWGKDVNLRARPVAFVNAGWIEPLKQLDKQEDGQDQENPALAPSSAARNESPSPVKQDINLVAQAAPLPKDTGELEPADELPNSSLFFYDLAGASKDAKPAETPPLRSLDIPPSPEPEEESDSGEVILFKGRSQTAARTRTQALPPKKVQTVMHDEIKVQVHVTNKTDTKKDVPPRSPRHSRPNAPSLIRDEINDDDDTDDAIVADYIANLVEHADDSDSPNLLLNSRDLGGDDVVLDDEDEESEGLLEESSGDSEDEVEDDKKEDIDDETLARLLSKQEELGMGSNELIISDGVYTKSNAAAGSQNRKVSNKARNLGFPSASAMADAFDDLDLMDWNRPSLGNSNKKQRKKQVPEFDVEDSDLQETLQSSWDKDRERKKQKKLEREGLRAAGMLGKNANPDDLRYKYTHGMSFDDIKVELREFLLSDDDR